MKQYQAWVAIPVVSVLVCLVALAVAGADGDSDVIPEGKFGLEVGEDLALSNDTLVIPMTLKVNPTASELGTRIQFRYMDKLSHDIWLSYQPPHPVF